MAEGTVSPYRVHPLLPGALVLGAGLAGSLGPLGGGDSPGKAGVLAAQDTDPASEDVDRFAMEAQVETADGREGSTSIVWSRDADLRIVHLDHGLVPGESPVGSTPGETVLGQVDPVLVNGERDRFVVHRTDNPTPNEQVESARTALEDGTTDGLDPDQAAAVETIQAFRENATVEIVEDGAAGTDRAHLTIDEDQGTIEGPVVLDAEPGVQIEHGVPVPT
jgi:hypothetical protein